MIERDVAVSQRVDGSVHAAWRAWTEPESLRWFLNPDHPVDDAITVDLRVGGDWRARMLIDAGTDYITGGRYLEIVPEERLVFLWGAAGGWPSFDDGLVATVHLEDDAAGGTLMAATLALPDYLDDDAVSEWFDRGIREGWTQTMARFTPAR